RRVAPRVGASSMSMGPRVRLLATAMAACIAGLTLPAGVAATEPGRVDARNLDEAPLERVVVRWADGPGAAPRATRLHRLLAAMPGLQTATAVDGETVAYWLPEGASTGSEALARLRKLARVAGVEEVAPDVRVGLD